MQQHHIDEAQIMEENLQKLIKNQNYFSCFIQNSQKQEQPTNPFQKKLFDKNLRRSAISCGHYSSANPQNSTLEDTERLTNSSRRNSLKNSENHNNQAQNNFNQIYPTLSQTNFYAQLISQPLQQPSCHKVSLAQSRHSDPTKQQITQIINNFRLELDYLEQKLHNKVDQLNCRYGDRECNQKQRQAQFMIESLQKIVGFMVENCVNLEDSVMYGQRNQEDNTGRNSEIMRKEVYQIEEDQNQQENISFNHYAHDKIEQFKPTHRFRNNYSGNKGKNIAIENTKHNGVSGKKRKIVGMIEKENINSNTKNQDEQNMPQTYYINSKLHSNNQNNHNKPSKPTNHQPTTRNSNQQSQKPTKRAPSKNSNQKPTQNNTTQNEPYHFHSSKQTIPNQSQYNSTSHNDSNHGAKSIYETVLEEREMRIKMKKKIV